MGTMTNTSLPNENNQKQPKMIPSAAGLLSMLSEPHPEMVGAALERLLDVVDERWHEVASYLPDLEALADPSSSSGGDGGEEEKREVMVTLDAKTRVNASNVASRVFFHLEEPLQALRLVLGETGADSSASGSSGTSSGNGGGVDALMNDLDKGGAYGACLVGAAVDEYVRRGKNDDNDDDNTISAGEPASANSTTIDNDKVIIDPEGLERVVTGLLGRCNNDGEYPYALGVALEARDNSRIVDVLDGAAAVTLSSVKETLSSHKRQQQRKGHAAYLAVLIDALRTVLDPALPKSFREGATRAVAGRLGRLATAGEVHGVDVPREVGRAAMAAKCRAEAALGDAKGVADSIAGLLGPVREVTTESDDGKKNVEEDTDFLLGLQLCFDIADGGDPSFAKTVADSLPANQVVSDGAKDDTIINVDPYARARRILTDGFPCELTISFLHKKSGSDRRVVENLRSGLEERASSRNSVLHNCAVVSHSYMNAGTTDDSFLRDHLDWMKKASNWAKFSATASLGVIHAGHTTEAMSLLEPYLPSTPPVTNGDDPAGGGGASTVQAAGGYAEGGSLYALGLIHGSRSASSLPSRTVASDLLRSHLRRSHANEPTSHGAALGVGLTMLGTSDVKPLRELRDLLQTDSAVAGEAAGMAVGMVLAGSGAGNAAGDSLPGPTDPAGAAEAAEIREIVTEMKSYASETQHEKIIRGVSMGLALIQVGRAEDSDPEVDAMRADRDPVVRYGAQYALALAYVGTSSKKAVRALLHAAVSDVDDDVRAAAVLGLAFVLCRTPWRVPELVGLLMEGFHPHVRYASCVAVGMAMAGTGDPDAVAMIEPSLSDTSDFVRQGAYLGTAMIYMQQGDKCNGNRARAFRERMSSAIGDKHQSTLTKMGAILGMGLIDAGGRNCRLDLCRSGDDGDPYGGPVRLTNVVGMALWLQHWHWYPMMHMVSLVLTPTVTVALKGDFRYPRNFEFVCDAKPSAFAYPKKLEEKKEEKKKRVETVTLSTTAKNKARIARKKAKEGGGSSEEGDAPMDEEKVEKKKEVMKQKEIKKETNKVNITKVEKKPVTEKEKESGSTPPDEAVAMDEGENAVASVTLSKRRRRDPEPSSFRLSNPCRVTEPQVRYTSFDPKGRYQPVELGRRLRGILLVSDSKPGEEEDLGTVRPPSVEEEDEAGPPEPFLWTPPEHPENNLRTSTGDTGDMVTEEDTGDAKDKKSNNGTNDVDGSKDKQKNDDSEVGTGGDAVTGFGS